MNRSSTLAVQKIFNGNKYITPKYKYKYKYFTYKYKYKYSKNVLKYKYKYQVPHLCFRASFCLLISFICHVNNFTIS